MNMHHHPQFLSQESKGSLVGRFWLKVSSGYSTVIEAWRATLEMADSCGCWRDSVPYYVGVSAAPPEWQLAADLAPERVILESKQKPYSYMILTSLAV